MKKSNLLVVKIFGVMLIIGAMGLYALTPSVQVWKRESACKAFQKSKLPTGATLLASRFYEGPPTSDGSAKVRSTVCMSVYKYSGPKENFRQNMQRKIQDISLPDKPGFLISFSDDKPIRSEYGELKSEWRDYLYWLTADKWEDVIDAMEKGYPKSCYVSYQIDNTDR